MSADPYEVLGLPPTATDDEVKAAYKQLARRYHPDVNPSPEAEERMKQINAAYDEIISHRAAGGSPAAGGGPAEGFDPFDPFGPNGPFAAWGGYSAGGYQRRASRGGADRLRPVRSYINAGQFAQALRLLSELPDRDGEWYFYSAVANAGLGNRLTALEQAQKAVQLEPDNYEYAEFLQMLQAGSSFYQNRRGVYSTPIMTARLCPDLFCLFCFCPFCRPC